MASPQNPLIVQGDHTLLLEVGNLLFLCELGCECHIAKPAGPEAKY